LNISQQLNFHAGEIFMMWAFLPVLKWLTDISISLVIVWLFVMMLSVGQPNGIQHVHSTLQSFTSVDPWSPGARFTKKILRKNPKFSISFF